MIITKMHESITPKKAEEILSDVHQDHYFIVRDGSTIKNLYELHTKVTNMDEETFRDHVNGQKNDFSNWILDIHKDNKLAKVLSKYKTKGRIAKHIKRRINHLHKIVNDEFNAFERAWNDLLYLLRLLERLPKKSQI